MEMKKHTIERLQLIKDIQDAAALYKKNLVGRKFLYVFEGKWIEVIYTVKGFKHLTGVESSLSAKAFFDNAIKRKLTVRNIYFTANHPYDLCIRKVNHLCQLPALASGDGFLLQNIGTKTQSYKFGATDLNFTLLFNQTIDVSTGRIVGDCLYVESLRDEDCFNRSANVYEVTHILSKKNDQPRYNVIHFVDKRYSVQDLPVDIIDKIDASILS